MLLALQCPTRMLPHAGTAQDEGAQLERSRSSLQAMQAGLQQQVPPFPFQSAHPACSQGAAEARDRDARLPWGRHTSTSAEACCCPSRMVAALRMLRVLAFKQGLFASQ